ncbi:hypothetical protein, partial [Secundilactobacillus paracollinoides]|uniref:hypothetical protein n=1 Tax=Secundilactobacillus paracollinoides TaxID=240427 RepID=UPI0006D2677E
LVSIYRQSALRRSPLPRGTRFGVDAKKANNRHIKNKVPVLDFVPEVAYAGALSLLNTFRLYKIE